VDDAVVVGELQGVGDAGDELGRFRKAGTPSQEEVRQRDALDKLAHDERDAIILADLVDGDNRGMSKLGDTTGLAEEAIALIAQGQIGGSRDLDRDDAVQLAVARLVDGAEGASANFLEQDEIAELALIVARRLAPGPVAVEVEAGAAGGAEDLPRRFRLDNLNRVLAVWTEDVHDSTLTNSLLSSRSPRAMNGILPMLP
jgi:hypothetical protein